jgi:hypothetical protein
MAVTINVDLRKGTIVGEFTVDDKLPLISALEDVAAELDHGGLAQVSYRDDGLYTTLRG